MSIEQSLGVALCALALSVAACSSSTSNTPSTAADAGPDAAVAVKGEIGDPCPKGNDDCATGLECAGEDPGGGQCFKACTPSKDSDCGDPTKFVCNVEGHCYLRCTATTDCKRASQGYVCKDDTPPRPPVKFCDTP